ncbi:hypothetical protein [Bartonella jaculi]|uniref:hypothetical protein n=1 Tax=Bartonella jaculi TaxID=686226 RepID=UPI0031EEC3D2
MAVWCADFEERVKDNGRLKSGVKRVLKSGVGFGEVGSWWERMGVHSSVKLVAGGGKPM